MVDSMSFNLEFKYFEPLIRTLLSCIDFFHVFLCNLIQNSPSALCQAQAQLVAKLDGMDKIEIISKEEQGWQ